MKLARVLTRSGGYDLTDAQAMVRTAVYDALWMCRRYGVEPIGAFEMALTETWDGSDQALRWEFTPDDDCCGYWDHSMGGCACPFHECDASHPFGGMPHHSWRRAVEDHQRRYSNTTTRQVTEQSSTLSSSSHTMHSGSSSPA